MESIIEFYTTDKRNHLDFIQDMIILIIYDFIAFYDLVSLELTIMVIYYK